MNEFQTINDMKPEAWTTSSNDALKLSLVDQDGATQFNPTFTYPIFGSSEQIFGYKGLHVYLAFDSITFKPFVNLKYTSKLDGEVEQVQEKLLEFLPNDDVIIKDEEKWINEFRKEQENFTLPDDQSKIFEYSADGENFAVYRTKLSDESIKKLHRRMRIFTLLFIESASYIDENDDTWDIFISFNKVTKQCVGYTTAYQYWRYMGAAEFDDSQVAPKRAKISQFLIFPPYQGKKHGSALYNAVFNLWLKDSQITEVTIEDPNEGFDDLRDRNDLKRLYDTGLFDQIPDQLPIQESWLESKRSELKLERRQFMRLFEMILLHNSSPNFRLQVKKRLFEKNYDVLADMDVPNRNDKLQTAFQSLKEDYLRILSAVTFAKRKREDHSQFEDSVKKTRTLASQ